MSITVSMHLSDYEELCEKHNKDIYVLEQKVKDMELILNGDFQTTGLRKELTDAKANYTEAYRQLSVVQKELAACKHELEHAQKSYTDILKRCTGQEELIEEQRKCITKKMEQIQIGDDTINEQEKVKKANEEELEKKEKINYGLLQKVKNFEEQVASLNRRVEIQSSSVADMSAQRHKALEANALLLGENAQLRADVARLTKRCNRLKKESSFIHPERKLRKQ